MQQPRITVLMPVYNGAKYLRPAIESVLTQTFADFEFLIIDDGSSDESLDICRSYADPRIRIEENGVNLGLIATLNKGLGLARGEYVARMDCDDISRPGRLEKQLRFMDEHRGVGGCGTWFRQISGGRDGIVKPPTEMGILRFMLALGNPFIHSTMLLRRSVLERNNLQYDANYKYAEDYEFWARCSRHTQLVNLPEVLLEYRWHPDNVSHRFRAEQGETADQVRVSHLAYLGIFPEPNELELHHGIARFQFHGDTERLQRAGEWLEKLAIQGCRQCGILESEVYRHLAQYWYGACGRSTDPGWRVWRLFRSSPIGRAADWEQQWKMLWRCAMRRRIE